MTAACPLPDGSLCGTCPDCQADAINDAQWPDGGISVVLPEQPAAMKPDRIEHATYYFLNALYVWMPTGRLTVWGLA